MGKGIWYIWSLVVNKLKKTKTRYSGNEMETKILKFMCVYRSIEKREHKPIKQKSPSIQGMCKIYGLKCYCKNNT
jgi:hypothetical protein